MWEVACFAGDQSLCVKSGRAPASQTFVGHPTPRARYEKQQPNFARWSNWVRGEFLLQVRSRMLTRDLFATANLVSFSHSKTNANV